MALTLDSVAHETPDGSAAGLLVVMSHVVDQPSEVDALVDAATRDGGTVLKPPKKGFFGGYHATYRAAEGIVWKVSCESKKDTGPATIPPAAKETIAILGVSEPEQAKAFYLSMGMATDHDYGNKFVDFELTATRHRLGLMRPKDLAKDTGATGGDQPGTVVLVHQAASRQEADAVMEAAVSAGGRQERPAAVGEGTETYLGEFSDPYGFRWKVVTA